MNSEQLRQFKMIADCRNITQAAERLYITQPALSTALRKLETELGTKLFERKGRTLSITEDGERLLVYANQVIDLIDAAQSTFSGQEEARLVRIYRIGATAINLLTAGCYTMKDYRIECVLVKNSELPLRLERGDADIVIADERYMGVMALRYPRKTFLYHQQLVLSVSADDPLARRDSIDIEELRRVTMFGHLNPLGFQDWENEVKRDNNVRFIEEFKLDNVTYFAERDKLAHPYLMSSFGVGSAQSRDYFRTRRNIPVRGKYTERDIYLYCADGKEQALAPLITKIQQNAQHMAELDSRVWE